MVCDSNRKPRRQGTGQTVVATGRRARLILFSIGIALLAGCGGSDVPANEDNGEVLQVEFTGETVQSEIPAGGRVFLSTSASSSDTLFEFQLAVEDEHGRSVPGLLATYGESRGRAVLYVHDPLGQYTPALYVFHPRDLEIGEIANELQPSGRLLVGPPQLMEQSSSELITASVVLLITVGSIAYAEVSFLTNAYKINSFYLSDAVDSDEEEGWVLYCKSPEELAALAEARVDALLDLGSIMLSFVVAGANVGEFTKLTFKVGFHSVLELNSKIVSLVYDVYGEAAAEIVDRPVGVKVYFEKAGAFRGFRNLFAYLEVNPYEPLCGGSSNNMTLALDWGASPRDLDLHWYGSGGEHVYFGSRGSLDAQPFVALDQDDTNGYGPETLTVTVAAGGGTVVVRNYSNELSLASSGARLTVRDITGATTLYEVPVGHQGRDWEVGTLSDEGYFTGTEGNAMRAHGEEVRATFCLEASGESGAVAKGSKSH